LGFDIRVAHVVDTDRKARDNAADKFRVVGIHRPHADHGAFTSVRAAEHTERLSEPSAIGSRLIKHPAD